MIDERESSRGAGQVGQSRVKPSRGKTPRKRPWKSPPALSAEEIQAAVDPAVFPPLLTVHQAAALLQMSHHTLYKVAGDRRYAGAVARGKPLRFWRDRLLQLFFAR